MRKRLLMHWPLVLLVCYIVGTSAVLQELKEENCILGCKCEKNLKIFDCDSPLYLKKSTLADLPADLTTLQFENVYIKRIEKEAFEGFPNLEDLTFKLSTIASVDSAAFDLLRIINLNFAKTTFVELPSFQSERLLELIFDDCDLTKMPSFDKLPALAFLNLANNKIQTIDPTAFTTLTSLEEIRLSNNSISELPYNLFIQNSILNTIILNHNPIKNIRLNIVSDLESLSLKHCQLQTFDRRSLENLTTISTLDLSDNQIDVLPIDAFENMVDLEDIDLSNNKIVELDDDIFSENSDLKTVDLSNNPLTSLPHFQTKDGSSFQIYDFACQNCTLKSLNTLENSQVSALENLKLLESINLSNNELTSIEGAFNELHELNKLIISNNKLQSLGGNSFAKTASLKILDISYNPLSPLDPVSFANIQYVSKLNISHTKLTKLWMNTNAILPNLKLISISENDIKALSVEDLKVTPELRFIELNNNPFVCDEMFKDVLRFFKLKSITLINGPSNEQLQELSDTAAVPTKSSKLNDLLEKVCGVEAILDENELDEYDVESTVAEKYDDDVVDDDDDDNNLLDDKYADDDDDDDDDDYKDELVVLESTSTDGRISLEKAYYVLSISAVFILTALVVLIVAVAVTLFILKKNRALNMHTGNLPRLKIPLWHVTPGHKKHSGSVYRPLSEDLSGSRTPNINRYEFKPNPEVHNSLP